MARKYAKKEATVINGPKAERYLACSVCDLGVTLNLAPQDVRPLHRCQPRYKALPFDIDVPSSQAPQRKWFEQKERHPRPRPAGDARPRIVL